MLCFIKFETHTYFDLNFFLKSNQSLKKYIFYYFNFFTYKIIIIKNQ